MFVAVSLWGCGEEDPGVLVKDDIAWQLGCPSGVAGCISFHGHRQADVEEKFKAKCDAKSGGLDIRIEDPGDFDKGRPGSILRIEGLDPENGTCGSVTVSEAPDLDANPGDFGGNCEDAECEVTGGEGDGWNFTGTIKCNNLKDGQGNPRTLVNPGTTSGIPLSVDNC
jgi:hypothetical protein